MFLNKLLKVLIFPEHTKENNVCLAGWNYSGRPSEGAHAHDASDFHKSNSCGQTGRTKSVPVSRV